MRTPPDDLDTAQIAEALRHAWGLVPGPLEYVAVGGGSHHWADRESGHWVTVDDLDRKPWISAERDGAWAGLLEAIQVSARLRAVGLEFVVAPLAARSGDPLRRLTERYALSVFPLLDATPRQYGAPLAGAEMDALVEALARLHDATRHVARLATRQPLTFPKRAELEAALRAQDFDQDWHDGPYAEPARRLLARHAGLVRDLVQRFDALVGSMLQGEVVVTHGEPHPGNTLFTSDGRLLLVDWDTVALAPPERDLWLIAADPDALRRYAVLTGRPVNPTALDAYHLRWRLDDIATFLADLRAPHQATAQSAHAWHALQLALGAPR